MASGYIGASDGGYTIDSATFETYAEVAFRLPLQPLHWNNDTNNKRYRIQPSIQHTVGASATLSERFAGSELNTDSSGSAEWIEFSNNPSPGALDIGPCSSVDPSSTAPKYAVEHMSAYDIAHRTSEVLGVGVELVTTDDYGDDDPAIDGALETIGRGSSWKPYNKQRPVSAWLMRRVIADTLNKIEFEARQLWTTPL